MDSAKKEILDGDIKLLLVKYSIPATVIFLSNVMYNLINGIFIGNQLAGSLGMAALSVVFPIQQIILALGQAIGIGIASIVSRSLGAGDSERAQKAIGTGITSSVLMGIIIMVVGIIFIEPILRLFGASDAIMPFAVVFFRITLYCSAFFIFSIVCNGIIQAKGHVHIAMISMVIGPLVNIPLDYMLITRMNFGIKGAAIANDIAQIICFLFLIIYLAKNRKNLSFKVKNLTIDIGVFIEAISLGLSTFMTQFAYGILAIVLNNSLLIYGHSDLYLSAFGIYTRVFAFITIPMYGIRQALQPIIGYNYGAKKYNRVMQSIKISIIASVMISLVFLIMIICFTRIIAGVFTHDQALLSITVRILRIIMLMSPLVGVQVLGASFFQYIGKPRPALCLSMMKQFIFLIPLLLILPVFFNVTGILAAVPLADFMTATITFIFLRFEVKQLRRLNSESENCLNVEMESAV